VIVNDDPDDYTLVEGVLYNIVHLKSRMHLHGDGEYVCVKNTTSFWSIRKAIGSLYNIIHLSSGRNLDSDYNKVFTSVPDYGNVLQYWVFSKPKTDTYNIIVMHPITKYRNLDSNGKSVNVNEYDYYDRFQQWSFEPENYNLTALVTEFSYPPDLKDNLSQIEKRLNSYVVEIRKTEFLGEKVSNKVSSSFHMSAFIFGLLRINTGIDFSHGIERQFVSKDEKIYRETISEEVTYKIQEQVIVPPLTSIEFGATIDQITIDIPFNATIRFTGKADRLDEYGNVVTMADVDIDALKGYLQKESYNIINVKTEGNSIIISTNGILKVDGYGLVSTIETKSIFHDTSPGSDDILTQFKPSLYFAVAFLIFKLGLARCALIPNNRVIVNNDDPDDYTLVEGVLYNIVHLKSRMHLHGEGGDVNVKNLNSYWSIRKAYDSLYNIVHLDSGRNLDSNSYKVYTGTPENANQFQHWEFTKLKNDTYNIKHLISQSRNLDSNGNLVYIGNEYNHYNPFQTWSFVPENYNLTALVTKFTYPPRLEDQLSKIEKRLNSYVVEIRKAEFLGEEVSNKVSSSFHMSAFIFGLLGINTGIDYSHGVERQFVSKDEKVYRETISEEVTYKIQEQVIVPPLTSIEFGATIDQITIDIPFNATIRFTGKADRLDEYGNVVTMADVDIDALKGYLQKESYNIINVKTEGNSIIISTNGTLKVDGYGLASTIETRPIFRDVPPDSNDPLTFLPDFGHILKELIPLTPFLLFMGAFYSFNFVRNFFVNQNYVEI
ncbi:12967_t:CDS:2, partial [Funneliformis geosporum]